MTEPTPDAPEDIEVVLSYTEAVGLDADTPTYTVTKPVNFAQLESEIYAASNAERVDITFTDESVVDAEHPVTVYVVGAKSKKSVNDAITAHEPDPQFGWSDEKKDRQAAIEKVQDPNATLSNADIAAALRAIFPPAPADTGVTA